MGNCVLWKINCWFIFSFFSILKARIDSWFGLTNMYNIPFMTKIFPGKKIKSWLINGCCISQGLTNTTNGPKPSLKIGTANAICWNSLGLFRDYGLDHIFFRNKFLLFFKIKSSNFQHLFEKEFHETSQNSAHSDNFCFFFLLSDWVEILWGFTSFFFKEMLKVSAFYLE